MLNSYTKGPIPTMLLAWRDLIKLRTHTCLFLPAKCKKNRQYMKKLLLFQGKLDKKFNDVGLVTLIALTFSQTSPGVLHVFNRSFENTVEKGEIA